MYFKKINDVAKEKVKNGTKTERQVLISSNEAPNFAMRKFTIEPGGNIPLHTNTVEHEQLVLGGSAEVVVGKEKFIAKKDDVVFIPAGIPHSYKSIGKEAFEFICVVPNKEDIIKIAE